MVQLPPSWCLVTCDGHSDGHEDCHDASRDASHDIDDDDSYNSLN